MSERPESPQSKLNLDVSMIKPLKRREYTRKGGSPHHTPARNGGTIDNLLHGSSQTNYTTVNQVENEAVFGYGTDAVLVSYVHRENWV